VEKARQKVYEAVPEYPEIEDRITDIAMECATKVFEGDKDAISKMNEDIAKLEARKKQLLCENGFPEDYLEEKYVCPDCRDTGYTDGRQKCHCLRQAILRFLYRQSNIEDVLKRENFNTLSYDYYTDTECERMKGIIDVCRRFADEFGKRYENILLYGNVGVGKTFLTNCMAKEIIDQGHSVIYFTSMRLFDTLSRELFSYNYDEDRSWDLQNDIFTCDLLIIDDLGTENVNAFVASRLFDILNERDLRRKSTIISTNLPFEELGSRYTERNISRIFGNYKVLNPVAGDIRMKKKRLSS
jgi:DNA replication protein DnaC